MDGCGIEERHGAVFRADQHHDLSAAQDDCLSAPLSPAIGDRRALYLLVAAQGEVVRSSIRAVRGALIVRRY